VSFVGGAWVQHGHDGDLNCGGDNIDHDLAVHVLQQEGHSTDLLAEPFLYHALVRRAARATKEALSAGRPGTFNLIVPLEGKAVPFRRVVTREAFIKIVGRHVRHCRSIVERCLSTVGWAVSDIKHVLLVGGSTRLPELHHELRQMLPVAVFHDDVDPMHAVALGAATYAEGLTEVAATCAYGYGIVVGGTHREVVPPNEYVPTPQAMFREVTPKPRTAYDGQTIYRCELVAFTEQREFLRIGKGSRRALRQGRYATCACRHRGFSSPLAR
jgi:molecular chaperone DnaK (HSP70)